MTDVDYSKMRGIADERHWNEFVQLVGGELVAPLIKDQGVQNADYIFHDDQVIVELKVLQTEFAHSEEMLKKVDEIVRKYPGFDPEDPPQPLRRELILQLQKPLQRIVNKANRQIKNTKLYLGVPQYRGVMVCVNAEFRGLQPYFVMSLIGNILSGTSYKSIKSVIYQTNHYVELPELPYAALLWAPMYSDDADDGLVHFVNNLGRKWRKYAERIDGPYDSSDEMETVRLDEAMIVSGVYRNKRFEG